MSIKNDKHSFIEQSFTSSENQYYNLNLNQSKKCQILVPVQSNSKPNNDKFCGTAATDFIVSDNYEEKRKLQSWNKSSKASTFTPVNEDNNDLAKPWTNKNNFNTTNRSTLSLHIAAYENSIEAAVSDLFVNGNIDGLKIGKLGPINASKHCFSDRLMNPFEFPRQQNENQRNEPEGMQFSASQRLLGSQQPATSQIEPEPSSSKNNVIRMKQSSARFQTRPQHHPKEGFRPYGTRSLAPSPEMPPPLQEQQKQQQINQNDDQGERNQGSNSNSMVNQSNQRARTPYREFGNSRRTPAPQFRNDHGRTRVEPYYVPPLQRQSERPPPLQQQQQRNENNDQGERNQDSNSNSMVNQSNQRARIPYREFGNSRRTPAPQFRNDHGRTRVELEQPPPQRQQKQREQPSRSRSSNTENRNTRQEHQPTPRSRSRSAVNRQSRSRSRQPRRSRSTRKPRDLKIFRNKIKITSNLDNVMNMMCIDMNQDNIPFVPNIFCHHEVINFEDQNESFNQIAALVEHLSK